MKLFHILLLLGCLGLPFRVWAVTYTSNNTTTGNIDGNIACSSTNRLIRTFTITNSFIINDLTVGFNATHTWRGDIGLSLQSPAGTTVQLFNTDVTGTGSENNFDLLLDDSSTNPVDDNNNDNVNPPIFGDDRVAQPANPLSAFDGENANGTWQLIMCDDFPSQDNGIFRQSRLEFDGSPVADLSIQKSDTPTTYTPGGATTYTITVTNNGPEDAGAGAVIADSLPTGVTLSGSVTCAGTGGAVCGAASIGSAGDSVFTDTAGVIPNGGVLTYTVPVVFSSDQNAY